MFSVNSLNSVTKIFDYSKMIRTCYTATSCVRDQDATTAPVWHMWETGSLNSAQFMLQWFISFPEFAEFSESSAPFRKNSNGFEGVTQNNYKETLKSLANIIRFLRPNSSMESISVPVYHFVGSYLFLTLKLGIRQPWSELHSGNRVFHQLDEIGNNANIGIRGFTTWK